jgi:hypothetical protein
MSLPPQYQLQYSQRPTPAPAPAPAANGMFENVDCAESVRLECENTLKESEKRAVLNLALQKKELFFWFDEEIAQKNSELDTLRTTHADECKTLEACIQARDAEIVSLKERLSTVESTLQSSLNETQTHVQSYKKHVLSRTIHDDEEWLAKLTRRVNSVKEESAAAEQDMLDEENSIFHKELFRAQQHVDTVYAELLACKKTLAGSNALSTSQAETIRHHRSELHELRRQLHTEKQTAMSRIASMEEEFSTTIRRLQDEHEQECKRLHEQVRSETRARDEQHELCDTLEQQMFKLNRQLREQEQQHQDEVNALKAQLNAQIETTQELAQAATVTSTAMVAAATDSHTALPTSSAAIQAALQDAMSQLREKQRQFVGLQRQVDSLAWKVMQQRSTSISAAVSAGGDIAKKLFAARTAVETVGNQSPVAEKSQIPIPRWSNVRRHMDNPHSARSDETVENSAHRGNRSSKLRRSERRRQSRSNRPRSNYENASPSYSSAPRQSQSQSSLPDLAQHMQTHTHTQSDRHGAPHKQYHHRRRKSNIPPSNAGYSKREKARHHFVA